VTKTVPEGMPTFEKQIFHWNVPFADRPSRAGRVLVLGFSLLSMARLPAAAQMHPDFLAIGERDVNVPAIDIPNQLSASEEVEQAQLIDTLLLEKLVLSEHRELLDYVQRLAEELRRWSDLKEPLHVRLVRKQQYLASATLAGYLYVDEDLLRTVASESELAGVLTHEIGHLAARHGSENIARLRQLKARSSQVSNTLLPGPRENEQTCDLSAFWKGVRYENEIEADELATEYLWNSGFDPRGLWTFLQRVGQRNESDAPAGPGPLTHPSISLRQQKIQAVLDLLPPLSSVRPDSPDFTAARARLMQEHK
jgi:predicted Zn-dependent protease